MATERVLLVSSRTVRAVGPPHHGPGIITERREKVGLSVPEIYGQAMSGWTATARAVIERLEFSPTFRNPHLQTMGGTVTRRPDPLPARLEHWPTPDDDLLRVHVWEVDDEGPVAVMLHGLEGSVRSPYLIGGARRLAAGGCSVVVMEHRSCGGPLNDARRLYHSGETTDLALVVERTCARWPGRPVLLWGVSLGGNQIAKWLGTETIPDAVRAAMVVSPPFDLVASGRQMDGQVRPYVAYFLRTLIPKAVAKERQYPGCLDAAAARRARTFQAFDDAATAPLHGFTSAEDYYRRVACGQFVPDVRVPTLYVAAQDDPFNPGSTIPMTAISDNPSTLGLFPEHGGHVGFLQGSPRRPRYWIDDVTSAFLQATTAL